MAADWHVLYQDPHKYFGAGGRSSDVIDVHFRIDTPPAAGHEGYITVDSTNYAPEYVAAMIQTEVDRVKAVAAL
jgi:hypothetical protein